MLPRPRSAAFTLIEVLIVISLMGILAATILPSANPTIREELHAAAYAVAADISWVRSLAVTNNSNYRITFSTSADKYEIQHVGANSALHTLPTTAFTTDASTSTKHVVELQSLREVNVEIELVAVQALGSTVQNVTTVEFDGLGGTTRTDDTKIWLATGRGGERRYLGIRVNHVTGLTWIEDFQATAPASASS